MIMIMTMLKVEKIQPELLIAIINKMCIAKA